MSVDFHLHTWCSDGASAPRDLLAAIRRQHLKAFAVTDHDTCVGWRELAGEPGLIPGVEMTAGHEGREIHVVGLGIDPDAPDLRALRIAIRARREERLAAIIERLPVRVRRSVTVDDLRDSRAPTAGTTLGRNHLARALVARGGVPTIREAFTAWLADEHTADGTLPGFPPVSEIADAIRRAGGVAILAHPGVYKDATLVFTLMAQGLDGLELAHPGLDPTLASTLHAAAAHHGWLGSVGTDLHWLGGSRQPGQVDQQVPGLPALLERLGIAA